MITLTWRQYRLQAVTGLALLGTIALFVLVTRYQVTSLIGRPGMRACVTGQSDCGTNVYGFGDRLALMTRVALSFNLLPLLVGVFCGSPLIAREFEYGTHQLLWTQSISRTRWLVTKLACFLGAIALASAVFTAMMDWWFAPVTHLHGAFSRMGDVVFDLEGLAPFGYTVFAFALGTAAGALIRRTGPAMAVTVGGFAALRIAVHVIRGGFMAPLKAAIPLNGTNAVTRGGGWILATAYADDNGVEMNVGRSPVLTSCADATKPDTCLTHWHLVATYQPGSRFWTFQIIEFSIFAALAVVLIGIAVRRTLT